MLIIKAIKRIIFSQNNQELFFFDTWKNDAIFLYKKFTNKNRIEIKTGRNTITNTNNLHATCMVMLSSSAPWRPGTSARQRRGRPWSLKFLFFYNGFSGPHKCISKKTASNHGEKVFHYADLSLGYVGISHYMSGLYCFKLDHFQTRAESIYFLITSPHISTFQPRLPIFIFAIASPNFQPVAVIY